MANNNVQNVRFLRNGNLYSTRDAARTALNGMQSTLTVEQDGSVILARYGSGSDIKTLAGYIYATDSVKTITIFDIDDAGADVDEKIQEIKNILGNGVSSANTVSSQLSTLSGTSSDTSAATSVNGAKVYAKDYTDSKLDALDYSLEAAAGSFIKSVSQADGKISATTEAMPTVTAISGTGQAITAVSQSNGTVSAVAGDIAAEHVTVADDDGNIISTTVEGAIAELYSGYTKGDADIVSTASISANTLAKLENLINSVSADGKTYAISAVTGEELSGLGANVREAYKLVDEDNTQSGEYIKIYKDSTLKSAEFTNQNLILTYILADGSESVVTIDMSSIIIETEVENGIQAVNHKLSIKLDTAGDDTGTGKFLTVGTNGLKLDGVTDAINSAVGTAISGLDASVSAETAHVSVKVDEVDGVLTAVTLTESDIASASALTAEIAARKAVDGQTGQTYEANSSSSYINDANSLNDADVKLAAALKSLSDGTVNQVKVNDVALTKTSNTVNVQISSDAATGTDSSPINVATDPSTGDVTLSIQYLDCGTYTAEES